jgi:isocitrate lyase
LNDIDPEGHMRDKDAKQILKWWEEPRWENITRPYSAKQVNIQ